MPNRLAEQTSPYLLQHRENPVDWQPWDEQALEQARSEDRPILLSVGLEDIDDIVWDVERALAASS